MPDNHHPYLSNTDFGGAKKIVQDELDQVKKAHKKSDDQLVGLALSGGGIRSATFSLGIMQVLAKYDWMKKINYLSTVSGGGYIGSSLTWFLQDPSFGVQKDDFPFGTERPGKKDADGNQLPGGSLDKRSIVSYLRQHGNYLTPGRGINTFSFIASILRGIILNILVYIPLLILSFWFLIKQGFFGTPDLKTVNTSGAQGWLHLFGQPPLTYVLFLLGVFVLACICYSLGSFFSRDSSKISFYTVRRGFDYWMGWVLSISVCLFFIGLLPIASLLWATITNLKGSDIFGSLAILFGLLTSIRAFFKSGEKDQGGIPLGVWVSLGSLFLIFGLSLLGYKTALRIHAGSSSDFIPLLFFVFVALILGLVTNLNHLSIHRYYRDRLMETYMPEKKTDGGWDYSVEPDKVHMSEAWKNKKNPYHIINTNIVLVDSTIPKFQGRGGDNFILSPLYCGSNATGWQETKEFMENGMTLPTAMAISGAAANPNTGVGGQGMTRHRIFSLVMKFLNLRLGYWAPWPQNEICKLFKFTTPNFFNMNPFKKMNEEYSFVHLTDGGHFENLGIYELIRRRIKVIIACDGGADPDFTFSDLGNLVERVRADFGAKIVISLDVLIPKKDDTDEPETAEEGHVLGSITYANGDKGILIFLKTVYLKELPVDLISYKKLNTSFPDQSTIDQFFDENQFEAYRELGFQTGKRMIQAVTKIKETEDHEHSPILKACL